MCFSPNKYHKLVALISHPFYPIGSGAFQDYYFWLIPVIRYAYLPIPMFSCSNAQKIPHKSWNHYLLCLNHSNRLIQTNAIMIPIAINRSGAIGPNKAITSVVIVDACLRNILYYPLFWTISRKISSGFPWLIVHINLNWIMPRKNYI